MLVFDQSTQSKPARRHSTELSDEFAKNVVASCGIGKGSLIKNLSLSTPDLEFLDIKSPEKVKILFSLNN